MEHLKKINKLADMAGWLAGKKVFLRADFNVPIKEGVVADAYRITALLPTLEFLQKEKAVTILASHIETKGVDSPTLKPVFEYIQGKLPQFHIAFCENFLDTEVLKKAVSEIPEGGFLLLENLRLAKEMGMSEQDNSVSLAMHLKEVTDIYVNDAFAVCHRAHASVDALPKLFDTSKKMAGFLLTKEIGALAAGLNPVRPFVVVLSGMKFSTKLPLIQKYLEHAEKIFIGGALFNNIIKSLGYEVGVSLIDGEAGYIDTLVKSSNFTSKVFIPKMVVVQDPATKEVRTCSINEVKHSDFIQDIAEASLRDFMTDIKDMQAKTILWNGPVGNYDIPEFAAGTTFFGTELFNYIHTHVDAHALIGGGDTVAAIEKITGIKDEERIFISTGGGAMLEFLEKDGQLPGIISLL
ncbi:MAG: phosphoglycerate kinase [Candidatus Parcubacteria bacterium]|jgi:phosphoglycerate kinase